MKKMKKLIPSAAAVLGMASLTACAGGDDGSNESSSVVVTSVTSSESSSTTQSTVTETEPSNQEQPVSAEPASGGCEPADFQAAGYASINHIGSCDGQWATGGQAQTDNVSHFRFTDGKWVRIENAGETFTGFHCYDAAALAEQGAPGWLLDRLVVCDKPADSGDLALPGTQCKNYDSGPLVVREGEISCDESNRVMDYYLAHASEGQGNIAHLTFEDWECATNTAGRAHETGWSSGCSRTDGVQIGVQAG